MQHSFDRDSTKNRLTLLELTFNNLSKKSKTYLLFGLLTLASIAVYAFQAEKRTISLSFSDYLPIGGVDHSQNAISNPASLTNFVEKLGQLRLNQTSKVRVFHFHDGTQTPNLVSYLSTRMQTSFGAAGLGMMRPDAFSQTKNDTGGPALKIGWNQRSLEQGYRIGLSGLTAISKSPNQVLEIAARNATSQNRDFSKVTVLHHNKVRSVDFKLDIPTLASDIQPTYTGEMSSTFIFDKSTPLANLKVKAHSAAGFNIDGVLLESEDHGVVYNDIPLTNVDYKSLSRARYLCRQMGEQFPDLIVLSLGFIEAQDKNFDAERFEKHLSDCLAKIKRSAPFASILITTPVVSEQEMPAFPNLQAVNDALRAFTSDHELALWDAANILPPGSVDDGEIRGKLLYHALINEFNKVVTLLP